MEKIKINTVTKAHPLTKFLRKGALRTSFGVLCTTPFHWETSSAKGDSFEVQFKGVANMETLNEISRNYLS